MDVRNSFRVDEQALSSILNTEEGNSDQVKRKSVKSNHTEVLFIYVCLCFVYFTLTTFSVQVTRGFKNTVAFVCFVCMQACACRGVCVEVRGQRAGVGSLLPLSVS